MRSREASTGGRCYSETAVLDAEIDRSAWRLLPSERVLWHGRPTAGAPRDRGWILAPILLFAFAAVSVFFAGLLFLADMAGAGQTAWVAVYLSLFAIAVLVAPSYLLSACEYMVTDRRVIWRRGRLVRHMDCSGITFGRIRWHRSVPAVGHLELVRAVPFGPLARKQRIVFHDVKAPDRVFAMIRGVEPNEHGGDIDVPLAERLDPGEEIRWGGHPEGWQVGWREIATTVLGLAVLVLGLSYGHRAAEILLGLEQVGLQVRSWEWVLFFLAVATTWSVIVGVGAGLAWWGLFRSHALGRETEYLLTNRRLLIRRGRTELSLDRRRIVDVADTPAWRGLHHLFLVLDAPQSRALADSGALGPVLPSRDSVPPVLYDLRDVENVKELILRRESHPSLPPVRDAA